MADLKRYTCKVCGADLGDKIATAQENVISCSYCNSKWTIVRKEIDDKTLSLITIAEQNIATCRFSDALEAYKKALELDPKEPEIYFGLALAKFKIQFLKDEVNNRLQPVCHEYTKKKFSDDEDYKESLELASERQRFEYEKKAREIDKVLSEFEKLNEQNIKYDTFICVKVTGEDNKKTTDYERAYDTYHYLKDKGYNPFFSEATLKDKTGSDYEAHILYALSVSKSMLVFCEDEAYLETKWVKNEYTRFLEMIADEKKKSDAVTIVFYKNPVEKLPGRKGKIQGIDYSKPTALEQIKNFVEKMSNVSNQINIDNIASDEAKQIIIKLQDEIERLKRKNSEDFEMSKEEAYKQFKFKVEDDGIIITNVTSKKDFLYLPSNVKGFNCDYYVFKDFIVSKDNKYLKSINGVLFSKDGKTLIRYPYTRLERTYTVPYMTEVIGEKAFEMANAVNVFLPDTIKEICRLSFASSKITFMNIPEGVRKIGYGAFNGCKDLEYIKLPLTLEEVDSQAFNARSNIDGKFNKKPLVIFMPTRRPLFARVKGWDAHYKRYPIKLFHFRGLKWRYNDKTRVIFK